MSLVVYNWDINSQVGLINPLSVVVKRNKNELDTAEVVISRDEYEGLKDALRINNIISIPLNRYQEERFRISEISIGYNKVEMKLTNWLNQLKNIICTKWDIEQVRTLTLKNLLTQLNNYIYSAQSSTIFAFVNVVLCRYDGSTDTRPRIKLYDPNSNSKWNEYPYINTDYVGENLYDILVDIADTTGLSFAEENINFVLSFDSLSGYYKENSHQIFSYNLYLNTDSDTKDFKSEIKDNQFIGCVKPIYEREINDRTEKEKETITNMGYQYNTWYQNLFEDATTGKFECRKLLEAKKFTTTVEWDKGLNMKVAFYYVPLGNNDGQLLFTSTWGNGTQLSSSNPAKFTVCNVLGETIAQEVVAEAVDTSYAVKDSGGTSIGYIKLTLSSESDWKYNVACGIRNEQFGAVTYKSTSYRTPGLLSNVTDKLSDSFSLKDPFGSTFGTVNLSNVTESNSGDGVIFYITHQNNNIDVIRGHVWVYCRQNWSDYRTQITTDIQRQALTYVNSYDINDLQTIDITPIINDSEYMISPNDTVTIYDRNLGTLVYSVQSVEYNVLTKNYISVDLGFQKETLRSLGKIVQAIKNVR